MWTQGTLYVADPSLMGTKIFSRLPGYVAADGLEDGELAVGVKLVFGWGIIRVNFMSPVALVQHLAGFEGWARSVIVNKDNLVYALARIRYVRLVMGCEIEANDGRVEEGQRALKRLGEELNALLFLPPGYLLDCDGSALAPSV